MSTEQTRSKSYLLAALLVSVGLLLYVSFVTYDHARKWTDLQEGLLDGLAHSVLYSIGYLLVFVPQIYLTVFVTRHRLRSVWLRSLLCLLPTMAVCGHSSVDWFTNPISDRACFKSTMGFAMPDSAKRVTSERLGGGISDRSHMYYFVADPWEIKAMCKYNSFEHGVKGHHDHVDTPNSFPTTQAWDRVRPFRRQDGLQVYTIRTDWEFTQAIVTASSKPIREEPYWFKPPRNQKISKKTSNRKGPTYLDPANKSPLELFPNSDQEQKQFD